MPKYLVTYYNPAELQEEMAKMSPEDIAKGMEPWAEWMANVGAALVDGGTPLSGGANISTSGSSDVSNQLSGYSILEANDLDAAKGLVANHPHLSWGDGCTVQVQEMTPMGPPE